MSPSRVAPDFAARDRQGRTVQLTDFRGRKVLLLTKTGYPNQNGDHSQWFPGFPALIDP